MHGASRQNGFTLIEIMIALVISLLLMVGIMQVFLGNRESYNVQSGMATLQENGRFAMHILRENLSMAGYPGNQLPFANTTDGGGANPDSFTLRYQATNDCLGNTVVGGTVSTMTFSVQAVNGSTGLACAPNGNAAAIIAPGVDNMQVLYGEDTDNDGWANWYVGTPTTNDVKNIRSVRIALLVNSGTPVTKTAQTLNYQLLAAPPVTFTDMIGRRIFTSTVLIRNPAIR